VRRGGGRWQSNARGLLFYWLLQNAVVITKFDDDPIVRARRGQARTIRGPKPRQRSSRALQHAAANAESSP
jgi:hypothetical protein